MNKIVGIRFAFLREELSKGIDKWSQGRVAEVTGLDQNQVSRLELGKGTIDGFITMLLFYQSKGYNLNWILSRDNETISKLTFSEENKTIDATGAVADLLQMRKEIDEVIGKLSP